jgi:hypothetical protein
MNNRNSIINELLLQEQIQKLNDQWGTIMRTNTGTPFISSGRRFKREGDCQETTVNTKVRTPLKMHDYEARKPRTLRTRIGER